MKSIALAGAVSALALLAGPAFAQQAAPAAPKAAISSDATQTVAGAYRLDPRHSSVIARIGHAGGVSLSTFRFEKAAGTLTWDPAGVEKSKVEVTVDPTSIHSPVPDFAAELISEAYLSASRFPEMKFTSTSIRRTGPNTGQITGDLTFLGKTKPLTVDARFVGGGRNARGVALVGFSGSAKFKRSDFGFTAGLPGIGDEVELILDLEFNQPAS